MTFYKKLLQKNDLIIIKLEKVLKIVLIFLLLYAIIVDFLYMIHPSFLDHVEPNIATTVLNAFHKTHGIYQSYKFDSDFELLYGPLTYLIHFIPLFLLGPSMMALKMSGFLLFIGSLILIFNLSHKSINQLYLKPNSSRPDLLKLKIQNLIYYFFLIFVLIRILSLNSFFINNRSDVALLFLSLSAAFIYFKNDLSETYKVVLISFLAGLACNFKIHGFIYFIPFLFEFIFKDLNSFFKKGFLSLFIFLIVFITPWIFLNNEYQFFLVKITQAGKHGLSIHYFLQNIRFFVYFIIFYFLLGLNFFRVAEFKIKLGVALSLTLALVFASKDGSGINHLVPFIATFILIIHESKKIYTFDSLRKNFLLIGLILYMIIIFIKDQNRMVQFLATHNDQMIKKAEIISLTNDLDKNSVAWGYTNNLQYESHTSLRPHLNLAQKDHELIIDPVARMDDLILGLSISNSSIDLLKSCNENKEAPQFFILPENSADNEFILRSYYRPHPKVFSDDFIKAFKDHYFKFKIGKFYSIYKCKS